MITNSKSLPEIAHSRNPFLIVHVHRRAIIVLGVRRDLSSVLLYSWKEKANHHTYCLYWTPTDGKALPGWTEENGLFCQERARPILKGQTSSAVKEEKGAISDYTQVGEKGWHSMRKAEVQGEALCSGQQSQI